MNKYKKLAMAAISVVMAGSMLFSFAACSGGGNDKGGDDGTNPNGPEIKPNTDADGNLSYSSSTTLTLSIGNNSVDTGITYSSANIEKLGGLPLMSTQQTEKTLKPAWSALQTKLNVKFSDVYTGKSASNQIGEIKNSSTGLSGVTAFTASAATINAESYNDTLLDINEYLDYMPNYKAFLEANPVVWASLISDAITGSMYMVPYFDGNDDIEKYVLMRKDLVETLLDGNNTTSTVTFAQQATAKNNATVKPAMSIVGTSATVSSFMGTDGSWLIETTDPSVLSGTPSKGSDKSVANSNATVKVRVDYDKALAAAKDTTTALGKAISDAAGKTYTGDSGNIVDLQNFAINETSGAVNGGQLLTILREYIDVAYLNEDGTASFYTSANGLTRASVFNSACAAWDADLYTALGRCFVTCGDILGSQVKSTELLYLISGRGYTTQRLTDVGSLAGELYGVRGLESRYNYSYFNAEGKVEDARYNVNTWEALKKINDLALEGLFCTADNIKDSWASVNQSTNTGIQTLSLHDYVQTQTAQYGFTADNTGDDYNFAPILTPVSYWDDNGDNTKEPMRFTESWRGVKDGGLAVSKANATADTERLAAVLAFIDYCYSSDGQMLMTYGPISSNGNTNPNGTWYANEESVDINTIATVSTPATSYALDQYTVKDEYLGQYFVYEGKVYSGTYYNGRQIPILTDENFEILSTKEGYNYTNHARQLLGTTLPVWNKDQGFEYLCTAPCGKVGADIVAIALNNGTVKHQSQTIDINNAWYMLMPTQLPYNSTITTALSSTATGLAFISGLGADNDNFTVSTSGTTRNIITDVMFYGFDTTKSITYVTSASYTLPGSAAGVVDLMKNVGLEDLIEFKNDAWTDLYTWYTNLK